MTRPEAHRLYAARNAKFIYDRGLLHTDSFSFKPFKWFKTFKPFFSIQRIGRFELLERFERLGVNPIEWTAKRRNLEYRSSEFLGLILYSDSLRLGVFLAKGLLGRSSD